MDPIERRAPAETLRQSEFVVEKQKDCVRGRRSDTWSRTQEAPDGGRLYNSGKRFDFSDGSG